MNIGVFDSGLGGLLITKALIDNMPEYNFCYLGDTSRVPYGSKSKETIYEFTKEAIDYLFTKKDCQIVIIACNTATFAALKKIQQDYLPQHFPDRRVLGVIIPTMEEVVSKNYTSIGLLATNSTVASDVYGQELRKINPDIYIHSCPAPLLVHLIENNEDKLASPVVANYIEKFQGINIDAMILGCTHYPHYKDVIKEEINKILGKDIDIISQDEFMPKSLKKYLERHSEIENKLSKNSEYVFEVTDLTNSYIEQAEKIFKRTIQIDRVDI